MTKKKSKLNIKKMPKNIQKVIAIAEYLINLSNNFALNPRPDLSMSYGVVTNLKLNKLIYYSQVWSLTLRKNTALFNNSIEAWVHGPVVPEVYHYYKSNADNSIQAQLELKDCLELLNSDEVDIIHEIWSLYGKRDGKYLEALTHSETPWQNARFGLETNELSNIVISHESMVSYYSKKYNEADL